MAYNYYKHTTTQLKKIAERHLHKLVVLKGKGVCFTCGRRDYESSVAVHAGHLFHGGADLVIKNLHPQCYICNVKMDGNRRVYKAKFIEKYGQKEYDLLEFQSKRVQIYSQDELIEMIELFKRKIKELSK